MSQLISFHISDRVFAKVSAAAHEEGISFREHLRLIIEAAVAIYEVEDRTDVPAGPITPMLRPRKWKRVEIIRDPGASPEAVTAALTAAFFGDPPPGRSALDRKRAAEAARAAR